MMYMLTQRFEIELCRPYRACIADGTSCVGTSPYANLFRPFGAFA